MTSQSIPQRSKLPKAPRCARPPAFAEARAAAAAAAGGSSCGKCTAVASRRGPAPPPPDSSESDSSSTGLAAAVASAGLLHGLHAAGAGIGPAALEGRTFFVATPASPASPAASSCPLSASGTEFSRLAADPDGKSPAEPPGLGFCKLAPKPSVYRSINRPRPPMLPPRRCPALHA
jgi:hypothetical protein